jgi:hypothetical protein
MNDSNPCGLVVVFALAALSLTVLFKADSMGIPAWVQANPNHMAVAAVLVLIGLPALAIALYQLCKLVSLLERFSCPIMSRITGKPCLQA